MKRLGWYGLVFAAVIGLRTGVARADDKCAVKEGTKAPPFSLSMADGSEGVVLSKALAKGKPVVVAFWAYHCVPCQKELPMLQQLSEELKDKVNFLLVHAGPDETRMKQKLAELKVTLPSASDDTHKKEERYCVTALPKTFVLDKTGIIQAILPIADEAKLREELAKLGAK